MDHHARADAAYGQYFDAEAKYAYFMAGVAIALTGYLGQDLEPVLVVWSPAALEALAVLLFLASAFCGLKRIEKIPADLRLEADRLWQGGHVADLRGAALGLGVVKDRGRPISGAEAHALAEVTDRLLDELDSRVNLLTKQTLLWSRARDYLLLAGLVALAISRIWTGSTGVDQEPTSRQSAVRGAPARVVAEMPYSYRSLS